MLFYSVNRLLNLYNIYLYITRNLYLPLPSLCTAPLTNNDSISTGACQKVWTRNHQSCGFYYPRSEWGRKRESTQGKTLVVWINARIDDTKLNMCTFMAKSFGSDTNFVFSQIYCFSKWWPGRKEARVEPSNHPCPCTRTEGSLLTYIISYAHTQIERCQASEVHRNTEKPCCSTQRHMIHTKELTITKCSVRHFCSSLSL